MENFYDVRKIYGQVFSFFLDAHKSCADKSTSGSGTDPPDDGWNRAGRSALRRFSRGNFSGENSYTVDLPPASRAPRPSPISFFPLSRPSFSLSIPFYARRNFISTTNTTPRRHLTWRHVGKTFPRAWNTKRKVFDANLFPGEQGKMVLGMRCIVSQFIGAPPPCHVP